jgi:3-(methylthio)propionyl---CoA ligase
MLRGLMMDQPLLIASLLRHAAAQHGDTEVVSRTIEGPIHRYTYRDAERRARQLAQALGRLGVGPGDRVATLAWNGYRHLELYYAVSGSGAVIHTINPRLFPDQLVYIVNHAEDRFVFFDINLAPLVEKLAQACPRVEGWVAMTDAAHVPSIGGQAPLCYEDLLAREDGAYAWPAFDEQQAAALCYTSGTTGHPKGVLYSHRSTVLHAYALSLPDVCGLSARDALLPVVPMFHANAWGCVYSAPLNGTKLVFPGAALDGKSLHDLFEQERVTCTAGVPTVWMGLLAYMKQNGLTFSTVKRTIVGGAACPPSMIESFRKDFGVDCCHAWGMTEMSPLGTACQLKAKHETLDEAERLQVLVKQGRAVFGVEMEIVDPTGQPLPHDGTTFGELVVRGPWVTEAYFKEEGRGPLRDGWFPTGDVATIDPDGYMQITDRAKDLIKSGGEWISSIDLENVAVAHPGVAEAAAIGVPHPRWGERPLIVAVRKPGETVTREDLLGFFAEKLARWMVPDDVVFVDALPHTATGKLAKVALREQLKEYSLPSGIEGPASGR